MSTPFSPQCDSVYLSGGHQEALGRLSLVVEGNRLGVLTGEVGSGKSTLIRSLLKSLDGRRHLPIYISVAGLKPRDFYGELLSHTGEEVPYALTTAKRRWTQTLEARMAQGDKTLIVVVDEAQEMNAAMLTELRFVVSHHMDARSYFPLILVGQPELRRTLRLKKNEALAQRVAMQYHLGGLSPEETKEYIGHQMKAASHPTPSFGDDAISQIHAFSQGICEACEPHCHTGIDGCKGPEQ